jgi:cystathionine beta-lyase/cystathionine gamma-synthase
VSHPSTAVLNRGYDPRLSVGSARPAVFRSSTYVFSSPESAARAFDLVSGRAQLEPGETPELIYSRFNHPNAQILEDQIVPLEEGSQWAVVFNSGMAAIMTSILACVSQGDAIVHTVPLYGGTQSIMHQFFEPFGIRCIPVVSGHGPELDNAILNTPRVKVVLIESPANPTMVMTDIRRAALTAARLDERPVVMVDNTFLGPAFQHPITLGADMVLYSATKYLGGFSDLLAGVAIGVDPKIESAIRGRRGLFGNILQPDECWILDGRLPTVSLRMNRQSKNAQRIAESLVRRKEIRKVYYPTLFDDPEQIRIRLSQTDYPGAMIAIDLKGGQPAAFEFLRNLKLAHNAVSLGGMETLACHPKTTIHASCSAEEKEIAGITDGLVRISVGVEDWRDLMRDMEQALDKAAALIG